MAPAGSSPRNTPMLARWFLRDVPASIFRQIGPALGIPLTLPQVLSSSEFALTVGLVRLDGWCDGNWRGALVNLD
jgi:hypothetical protein